MPRTTQRDTSKVGRRGSIVLPATLRRQFGIEEGALVIAEARADGILIRPAVALPVEVYTPERTAQFLLSNAVDAADYADIRQDIQRDLGLDPDAIDHVRPAGA